MKQTLLWLALMLTLGCAEQHTVTVDSGASDSGRPDFGNPYICDHVFGTRVCPFECSTFTGYVLAPTDTCIDVSDPSPTVWCATSGTRREPGGTCFVLDDGTRVFTTQTPIPPPSDVSCNSLPACAP
jgi:hypothetical protein